MRLMNLIGISRSRRYFADFPINSGLIAINSGRISSVTTLGPFSSKIASLIPALPSLLIQGVEHATTLLDDFGIAAR